MTYHTQAHTHTQVISNHLNPNHKTFPRAQHRHSQYNNKHYHFEAYPVVCPHSPHMAYPPTSHLISSHHVPSGLPAQSPLAYHSTFHLTHPHPVVCPHSHHPGTHQATKAHISLQYTNQVSKLIIHHPTPIGPFHNSHMPNNTHCLDWFISQYNAIIQYHFHPCTSSKHNHFIP